MIETRRFKMQKLIKKIEPPLNYLRTDEAFKGGSMAVAN